MKISLMSSLRKSKYANYRDTHEIITFGDYYCYKNRFLNLDFLNQA